MIIVTLCVFRQGEPSHSTYIVLSGRLRSVFESDNGRKEIVSEFGRGDTIGVIEFATGTADHISLIFHVLLPNLSHLLTSLRLK